MAQGVFEGVVVWADEIQDYCNETFYEALYLWNRTKTWGWAHAKGWADEPLEYVDAVMAIEDAKNAVESEEFAKAEASRNAAGQFRKG